MHKDKTQDSLAVEIQGVSKVFGAGTEAFKALDKVALTIGENEFFTLLGPSGCGKTTLLRMIAGFEHPTEGRVLLHGEDISELPPYRRPVNTVFQNYALFPHLSVAQNIAFGLEMLGKPKLEIESTVDRMLKLVQMEAMKNRHIGQISGGQQQRVALARALAPSPRVLLLDEPLSALDLKLRKEMQGELKRLQHETGITFVFVTHDQEEALTMSDRIAVMCDGKVLQVGSPRAIYDRPQNRFVAQFIGETNFLEATLNGTQNSPPNKLVQLTLSNGTQVSAEAPISSLNGRQQVILAIRPEYIQIEPTEHSDWASNKTALAAVVTETVYFGTDTHYHLQLDNGATLVSRQQNARDQESAFTVGTRVGIHWDKNAAQILTD